MSMDNSYLLFTLAGDDNVFATEVGICSPSTSRLSVVSCRHAAT